MEFLNKCEELMGFEPSQVYEVPHKGGPCWLIVGDKKWQIAPPMVGLYTLFIRVGFMHTPGDSAEATLKKAKEGKIKIGDSTGYAGNRDCSYISQAWKGIQVILKHGVEIFHDSIEENYPKDLPDKVGSLHDYLGPVNFAKNASVKKAMPHWFRAKYWK